MSLVFNVLLSVFQSAVRALQSAVPKFCHSTSRVLQHVENQSAVQSAVWKVQPTQWDGMCHSTTALLLSYKDNIVYVYVCACVYRGSSRGVPNVLSVPS